MSAAVATLPTRANVKQAWEEYQALVIAMHDDTTLMADADHCMAVIRAWKRWSDLFLAWDARC